MTKNEYFALDDEGYPGRLGWTAKSWRLKTIQDCVALHEIEKLPLSAIAEVGGGKSRILPLLASPERQCFNIEAFEGTGQGPTEEIRLPNVTNVLAKLGEFDPLIADGSIDLVFSISVVEHVPDEEISAFFEDTARILRSGGIVLHLIDAYVHTAPVHNDLVMSRITLFTDAVSRAGLQFLEPAQTLDGTDVCFNSSYATNSDHVLANWNRLVPHLRDVRCESQSCTLLMACRKP